MALELCKSFGLLSPLYENSTRNGCFFCPNQGFKEMLKFRQENPELWNELLDLGKTKNLCSYGFKYGETIEQVNSKLDDMELCQKIQLKLF